MTTRRAVVAGTIAIAAAGSGLAVGSTNGPTLTVQETPMYDKPRAQVASIPAAARDGFNAFRRGRRAGDELPEMARATIAAQPQFGENPALSRRVVTARGRQQFLVPGDGVVGLYDEAGAGTVSDVMAALDGRAVTTEMCTGGLKSGQMAVVGLLPADAVGPALVLRDGRRQPLAVTDGVYDVAINLRSAGDLPDRVEWTVGGQRRSALVPGATEDALNTRCAE